MGPTAPIVLMNHLQVDHFFLSKANHTNSNAKIVNCLVCLAKKKAINLKMAHNYSRNMSLKEAM